MKYHFLSVEFDELIRDKFPKARTYVEGKYTISGEFPQGFEGEIVDLSTQELTDEQLLIRVDELLALVPAGGLVITSQAQGDWIIITHPSFAQAEQ